MIIMRNRQAKLDHVFQNVVNSTDIVQVCNYMYSVGVLFSLLWVEFLHSPL